MFQPTAKNREDAIQQLDLIISSFLNGNEDDFLADDFHHIARIVNDFVGRLSIHHALDADHKERDEKDERLTNEIKEALPTEGLKQKLIELHNVRGDDGAAEGQIKFLAGLVLGLRAAESLMQLKIEDPRSSIDWLIEKLKNGEV